MRQSGADNNRIVLVIGAVALVALGYAAYSWNTRVPEGAVSQPTTATATDAKNEPVVIIPQPSQAAAPVPPPAPAPAPAPKAKGLSDSFVLHFAKTKTALPFLLATADPTTDSVSGVVHASGLWEPHITQLTTAILQRSKCVPRNGGYNRLAPRADECLVLDVGMNLGWFSMLFATLGARVHAFEPQTRLQAFARASIMLNGYENAVTLHQNIVSNVKGGKGFIISNPENFGGAGSYIGDSGNSQNVVDVGIPTVTLDEFLRYIAPSPSASRAAANPKAALKQRKQKPRSSKADGEADGESPASAASLPYVTLIKADIENNEPSMLLGARDALGAKRIGHIVFEILDPNEDTIAALRLLGTSDYHLNGIISVNPNASPKAERSDVETAFGLDLVRLLPFDANTITLAELRSLKHDKGVHELLATALPLTRTAGAAAAALASTN